jgi:hypothetical protein
MSKMILYVQNQEPIHSPTVDDLKTALEKLNGQDCTMIELTSIGKGTLMATGGNNKRQIVTFIPENIENDSPSLFDKTKSMLEEINLSFEGEMTPYPGQFAVEKDLALKAFDYFLNEAKLCGKLEWKQL